MFVAYGLGNLEAEVAAEGPQDHSGHYTNFRDLD